MKEYKILKFKYDDRSESSILEIENKINEYAKDNWKVVNFVHTDNLSGRKFPLIALIEREIL